VSDFEKTPSDVRDLLGKRISQLGLRLEGSPVERFVLQLYRELERKGLKRFRPVCYLTDEWGCPDGQPVIGIPFYLADPQLARLERAMNDLEDEREIMMYLRHEAGHAFNYAYRLYATPEWRARFGPYNRRYRDHYRPVPFSRKHVRHIAGWYAQKHPDEDFAETFAVWLTPRSNWRRKYKWWPALLKLRYVDRVVRRIRDQDPVVSTGDFDITVEDMKLTVGQFYRRLMRQNGAAVNVALQTDLADMFIMRGRRRKGIRPAGDLVEENRLPLTDKITYWTGVKRPLVRALIERIIRSCRELQLYAEVGREREHLVEVIAFVERPQGDQFGDDSDHQCPREAEHDRHRERSGELVEIRRQVGAHHVERAMGEVDQVHDAEHQRQPGGQQKQHHPELQPVERLLGEEYEIHQ